MRPCPSTKAIRSGCRAACVARLSKGCSLRHSPAARQRTPSSGLTTVWNCMRISLARRHWGHLISSCARCATLMRALPPLGSAPALNGDDRPAMRAIANLLVLVVGFNLEADLATIDLHKLGAHRDLLAFWRGAKMLDVDFKADRGVPLGQMGLHRLDAGALHQADHARCRQHALAAHVPDHQLVIDRRDDLGLEAWCKSIRCHAFSPYTSAPDCG